MTAYKHIELIFPKNAGPGDILITTPATDDQPGRARLGPNVKLESLGRVLSSNGGGLIGIIAEGEPLPPYRTVFYLEGENGSGTSH